MAGRCYCRRLGAHSVASKWLAANAKTKQSLFLHPEHSQHWRLEAYPDCMTYCCTNTVIHGLQFAKKATHTTGFDYINDVKTGSDWFTACRISNSTRRLLFIDYAQMRTRGREVELKIPGQSEARIPVPAISWLVASVQFSGRLRRSGRCGPYR